MLNISVVGIGNAGSQVAALAAERLKVPVLAINSSEKDLQTIPDNIPHYLMGDEKGAGKERGAAKKFFKDSVMDMLKDEEVSDVFNQEVVFIVSSTGGGTGSGTAPIMANVIQEVYRETKIILIGILPTLREALSTQVNTIEYMKELYETLSDATYMVYDNEKLAKLPTTTMMQRINQSIVDDIDVIRGTYQRPTRFASIDEKDAKNIISTPGRIVIVSLRNLKEKDLDEVDLEDLLIEQFKTNPHCEIQRDKIVMRTGVISLLSDRLNERFDTNLGKVQTFIGTPVESFEHILINDDRQLENCLFLIAAGMTQINDRIRKISDRIEEINDQQNQREDESELAGIDVQSLNNKIDRRTTDSSKERDIDVRSILDKFGV